MRWTKIGAAGLSVLLAAAAPAQTSWVSSWTASPETPQGGLGPIPATRSFSNQTLRQFLRLSAGGTAARVRLTNAFGAGPLRIGAARIALVDAAGREVAGTGRMLTFDGVGAAVIPKGAPLLTDPIRMVFPALSKVAVTIYLPEDTGPCTCHALGLDRTEVSPPGDFTTKTFIVDKAIQTRAFLTAVEVEAPVGSATVAIIGDSITDGQGSTSGAAHRWPDILADRLSRRRGRIWAVANQGISGNRVLTDGIGPNALARFDRDVLSLPGLKTVIVFEGVNDLGMSFGHFDAGMAKALATFRGAPVTAAQIIAGYRQLIARAHARGVRIYGATITGYKGAGYWSPDGEAARKEINRFIRAPGNFDAVIDFDRIVADPADPDRIRDGYHAGDHLHGSDAGYEAMGRAIDLNLFPR